MLQTFACRLWRARMVCLLIAPMVAHAQTPLPRTPPSLPTPLALPPGPPVADWQPRDRAVTGGIIVVTGQNFRPAEFQAAIGPSKIRLPVRLATSTSTRIELDVPEEALGRIGTLAVGYPGTRGTILDETYRIDPPSPSLIEATAGAPLVPHVVRSMVIRVREFPGARLNQNDITFGGTCRFHLPKGTTFGSVTREPDLSIRVAVQGWFEDPGSCQLQVTLRPLTSSGASMATVQLTAPFTVAAPTRYTLETTGQPMIDRLKPNVVQAGIGNVCQASSGDWPGGQAVGVTTLSGDMQMLIRGNLIDVNCTFQTDAWLMPQGVQLAEIEWGVNETGNRCGPKSTLSAGLPGVSFTMTRGSVEVRPSAGQAASTFTAFGDDDIVVDGVTFATGLHAPRTLMKPLVFPLRCVSMATILTDAQGRHGPTASPQSFGVVLRRLVFTGPPGLSITDILR